MNPLERQYRLLLWLAYPTSYLAHREDELITTLLDTATPGQQRVHLRDAADLLRSGIAVRTQSARIEPLRHGATRAAATAMAALPAVAALVLTVQLAGTPWNDDTPALLVPYWTLVAATPLLAPIINGRRKPAVATIALVLGAGLIAGSEHVLVQPLTILAIAMFAALALLLPNPRRPSHIGALIAAGAAVGAVAGARALTVLATTPNNTPRPRDMFATHVLDLPQPPTFHLVALAAAVACVILLPRLGTTLALLAPPTLICAVTLLGNDLLTTGADRPDKIRALVLITALGLTLTTISTTRAIRTTTTTT